MDDRSKGTGNGVHSGNQYTGSQNNIDHCSKWNQKFRNLSNAFCASQQHRNHQHCQNGSQHQIAITADFNLKSFRCAVDSCEYRIDLGPISNTKGRNNAEKAIEIGQRLPSPPQSKSDHIHGTALIGTVCCFYTKTDSQGCFRKFQSHAKNGTDPHPKDTSRTTDGNRTGHARQIPGAHCCSQRSTQGLKGRYSIRCIPAGTPGHKVAACFRKQTKL